MGCKCVLDQPAYPQNDEWGPLLWKILHVIAEKSGKQSNIYMREDEKRAWPLFIKYFGPMIPCPFCRDHYNEWAGTHPFNLPNDYALWQDYIKRYFYDLHEMVNARLEKPSFSYDQLTATYGSEKSIKDTLRALDLLQQRAIKMGGINLFSWDNWLKPMKMLRGIYGV